MSRRKPIPEGLPLDHPDFPHGDYRGRIRGCPCDPCSEASATYYNDLRKRQYLGTSGYVPSSRIQRHARWLLSHDGVTKKAIDSAAGLPEGFTTHLFTRGRGVTHRNAQAYLAVRPEHLDRMTYPYEKFQWRLNVLRAQGFPSAYVTDHAGIARIGRKFRVVTKATWDALDRTWEKLREREASPEQDAIQQSHIAAARNAAKAAGWHPSWMYANEFDLHPAYLDLDEEGLTAQERREREDEAEPLFDRGWSVDAVATYFTTSHSAAAKMRERINRRRRERARRAA